MKKQIEIKIKQDEGLPLHISSPDKEVYAECTTWKQRLNARAYGRRDKEQRRNDKINNRDREVERELPF